MNMVAEIARDPETSGLPISGIGASPIGVMQLNIWFWDVEMYRFVLPQ